MEAEPRDESSTGESGWRILFKVSLFIIVPSVLFAILAAVLSP